MKSTSLETQAVDQSQNIVTYLRLANEYRRTVRLSTRDAESQAPDSGPVDAGQPSHL